MGAESGRVRTHVDTTQKSMYISPEVLRGVLYPKAHSNGFEKEKKKQSLRKRPSRDNTKLLKSALDFHCD